MKEGLAQGPYVAARAGFEPTTLRWKGIDSTNAPPRPTLMIYESCYTSISVVKITLAAGLVENSSNYDVCEWTSAKGNISVSAEFNFLADPEAARVVLRELRCPATTLVTWELCTKKSFTWV